MIFFFFFWSVFVSEGADKLRRVGWFQESTNVDRDVGEELV